MKTALLLFATLFATLFASSLTRISGQAVTVGFSQTEYSFNEDEGGLVCVVIVDGAFQGGSRQVTLTLNATDGSATAADSDFDPSLLVEINLSPSTTSEGECISSTILSDSVLEDNETFTLTINNNNVILSPTMSQAQVTIINDDAECQAPPDLSDGSFSLSSTRGTGTSSRGDIATYSCSFGFDLVGVDVLTCELGNVWSPSAPGVCQVRDCGPLEDPTNGQVDVPATIIFSTATYSCDNGYRLVGEATRRCGLNSRWTNSPPTCEAVDCGPLTSPADGSVDYSNTTFMSIAIYSCNNGFVLEGGKNRTCQADGTWSGSSTPTCRVQSLITVDGGTVLETASTVEVCVTYDPLPVTKTTINLSTRDSTAIAGEDYLGFVGDLVFSPTTLSRQCINITILEDSNLEDSELFEVVAMIDGMPMSGSLASIIIQNVGTVIVGFTRVAYSFNEDDGGLVCVVLVEGAVQRTSTPVTLTLNATDGSATAADSDFDPSLLVPISLSPSTTSEGECISSTILPDSVLEGNETFTLTINNNTEVILSPTMSEAQVVIINDDAECLSPPELPNGSFSLSSRSLTGISSLGDLATYSCSLGFDLVGVDVLTCEFGNVWSPVTPGTCQARDCGPLDNPANGYVDVPSTVVFSRATYSCNYGYELVGETTRFCGLNKKWSSSPPTCEAVDCGGLRSPNYGSVDYTTTTFLSTATYSCDNGFILEGDSIQTCQGDGTWSGSARPTCRRLAECPQATDISNGHVTATSNLEGDTANYSCSNGYTLEGGRIRTCQPDGSWSGTEPTCRELAECLNLTEIPNGHVTITSSLEGGTATYSCDPGFISLVESTRTCRADGTWSGTEPSCVTVIVVGPDGLTDQDRSQIILGISIGFAMGGIVLIILIVTLIILTVICVHKKRSNAAVYGRTRTTGSRLVQGIKNPTAIEMGSRRGNYRQARLESDISYGDFSVSSGEWDIKTNGNEVPDREGKV